MARRSAIDTKVPKELLAEFNARLIDGGFSDYSGLTVWINERLAAHGLELRLCRDTVYRHGRDFQAEFEADMAESRQLYHVAKASLETNDDPEGIVREATIRTLQTRLLKLSVALREAEKAGDDPHALAETTAKIAKAIADLSRADISSQKYKSEVRAKIKAVVEKTDAITKKGGMSKETAEAIRREILGIGA